MIKLPSIEPLLQELRIIKIKEFLENVDTLVDIGCDIPPKFLNRYKSRITKGIGIDEVIEAHQEDNLSFIKQTITKKVNIPDKTADAVTLLAVLEHMKYPKEIIEETHRILKPGGRVLITVPSPRCEPLLNMLAPIGLVRESMIDQHENYFTHEVLRKLLLDAGYNEVLVEDFEFGFNTFATGKKA